ncbi:MAG TPA: hypothetical protein VNB22_23375 [Pyrinomonadaceae bacterium]|jgi:hypothetical protein|nr:hypothetical protein [Pyrinomonadaceae bacterium]
MLKSELARRSFAALWFAVAAAIPVGFYFLVFLFTPFTSGIIYRVVTTVVPVFAAGIGGLWLGAGILDEKKTKSPIGAAGRGLAIAAFAYLFLFIFELVFGVIYNNDQNSEELYRLIEVITTMFLYGLLLFGWLIAVVGAAAGGLLYLFRSETVKAESK